MRTLESVAEFAKQNKIPISESPCIPDKERCALRLRLLREEIDELEAAIEAKDEVEILDALCDIEYIAMGGVLDFGMQNVFQKAFDEVHSSNMTKPCSSVEEAEITIADYAKKGIICHYEEIAGKFVIFRTQDNKVMKNINYRPANLSQFIEC